MFPAKEHSIELAAKLYSFQQENVLCDTVLLADDSQVWTHSVVLAAVSPYFYSNFLHMSRHDTHFRFSLKLSGCDSVCIRAVLRFLYTGSLVLPRSFRQPQLFTGILQVCEKLGINATKLNGAIVTFVGFNPYNKSSPLPERELRPQAETSLTCFTDSQWDAAVQAETVLNGKSESLVDATDKCKILLEEESSLAVNKRKGSIATENRDIDVKLEMNVFEVSPNCDGSSENKDGTVLSTEDVIPSLPMPVCETVPAVVTASFATAAIPVADFPCDSVSELLSTVDEKKAASNQRNASVRMATRILKNNQKKRGKLKVGSRRKRNNDTMASSSLCHSTANGSIGGRARYTRESILCRLCGKRFRWQWDLRKHMETYQAHSALTCRQCGKVLTCKRELHAHEKLHAGHRLHACPTCGKVYRCRSGLVMHLCEHTGQMPYLCDICGAGFKNSFSMGWHKKRQHSTVRPFVCEKCGKGFIHKVLLRRHMQVHSTEKPHICHKCGMKFSYHRNLSRHLASHVGNKPHCCGVCGKSFSRIDNMQSHALIHKGERNHTCSECQKVFKSAILLKRHLTIHSDENLHTCDICGKRFTAPIRLKQHVVMHQEKLYKCRLCDRTFSFERFLLGHVKKCHQDTAVTTLPSNDIVSFIVDPKILS